MLLFVALPLIVFGALAVSRPRGLLHWRRGYRNVTRFQRTWLVKPQDVRKLRISGAVFLGAGLALTGLAFVLGQGAPTQLAFAWP